MHLDAFVEARPMPAFVPESALIMSGFGTWADPEIAGSPRRPEQIPETRASAQILAAAGQLAPVFGGVALDLSDTCNNHFFFRWVFL